MITSIKYLTVCFFTAVIILPVFTGCNSNSIKDLDGNKYKTITIGAQVWMKENLKTTRYNNGTAIPMITDYDSWAETTAPAYCWYNNDSTNKDVYGALYNWFAADTKKLCPTGWHVPSDSEWMELMNFLEDPETIGDKLKEAGTSHWRSPNSEANNESGFTALPGGYRSYNGSFNYQGISGYWWSSTEYDKNTIYILNLRYKSRTGYKFITNKTNGFSVRCLKDQSPKNDQN